MVQVHHIPLECSAMCLCTPAHHPHAVWRAVPKCGLLLPCTHQTVHSLLFIKKCANEDYSMDSENSVGNDALNTFAQRGRAIGRCVCVYAREKSVRTKSVAPAHTEGFSAYLADGNVFTFSKKRFDERNGFF